MPFVAILGAGDLGGSLAFTLAQRARFDEIRLIDPAGTVAAGKALDIRQAGPSTGAGTRVTGHADVAAAAGAWVVALADPLPAAGAAVASAAAADAMLRAVCRLAPGAVVVCADASHGARLRAIVGAGLCAPDLLVGSAPAAAASAARALLAVACRTSPTGLSVGIAAGDGTSGLVIDWTRTAIRGRAAEALPREQRARLDEQFALIWPPGPVTLAAAAARLIEAAWFGSRHPEPAWVVDRSLLAAGASPVPISPAPALVDVVCEPGGRLRAAPGVPPC